MWFRTTYLPAHPIVQKPPVNPVISIHKFTHLRRPPPKFHCEWRIQEHPPPNPFQVGVSDKSLTFQVRGIPISTRMTACINDWNIERKAHIVYFPFWWSIEWLCLFDSINRTTIKPTLLCSESFPGHAHKTNDMAIKMLNSRCFAVSFSGRFTAKFRAYFGYWIS